MSDRIRKQIAQLRELIHASEAQANSGSFAYSLQVQSLKAHLEDLSRAELLEEIAPTSELIDFRLIAERFKTGTVPLDMLAGAAYNIRRMLGYAALRITEGGMRRVRVPKELYNELDLRLVGLLPGSSRLLIAAASNRDLFDYGVAKRSIERVFSVLDTRGRGKAFLEAVTDMGPSSVRGLREFLRLLRGESAGLEITWTHSGVASNHWNATSETVNEITSALEQTTIADRQEIVVNGKIELLSKHERIHVRTETGGLIRILFPKRLLDTVIQLHLDQYVSLRCTVTETENPLTNESLTFYELAEIISASATPLGGPLIPRE